MRSFSNAQFYYKGVAMVKSFSSYLFAFSMSTAYILAMEPQKQLLDLRNGASWTPLHVAVSVGNEESVKALLESGARIDSRTIPTNRTPLMFCAEHGKNTIAALLLKKGTVVDQTDNNHMTALHIACQKGHCDVVETLVLASASLGMMDGSGNLPIAYALAYKDFSDPSVLIAFQKALKKKSDIENEAQGFVLHRACQNATIEEIEKLIAGGAKLDELDKTGNSAIHYAAAHTNPEVLKTLLAAIEKKKTEAALPVALPSASLATQDK